MKHLARALALLLALLPAAGAAQTFPTVPSSTVIGRLSTGTGPSQAIPISILLAQIGGVPTTRSILTTSPLSGGGDLSADRTLSISSLGISTTLLANNAVTNSKLATMPAFTFKGNNTSGAAVPTDVDIAALTTKGSPAGGDYVIISDQAASGAWKKATVSSVGAVGAVTSIAGNAGAFTLSGGVTNSGNDIRLANNGAVLNAAPANPAGLTSTTQQMFGLGVTTCRVTPVYSTRLRFTFIFRGVNASGTGSFSVRYGTGAGPATGATASSSGTSAMANSVLSSLGANSVVITLHGLATGLTPATAVWFDVVGNASAGTTTISDITCMAEEF